MSKDVVCIFARQIICEGKVDEFAHKNMLLFMIDF